MALLFVALVQSSGIRVTGASTVPPTAIDPALLHTLQVRYKKTLAKQLTRFMPTPSYIHILVDTARQAGRFDRPVGLRYPSWRIYRAVEIDQSCLGQARLGLIEEGLVVPKSQADRIESGVLGEYALGFGKGYFIHGTSTPASLGRMSRTVVSASTMTI